jgi:dimethylaniline monooxygenase (N-oxide forming)
MFDITDAAGAPPVAVIGAGPAGLTAAKHLLEAGFEPTVLEQSDDLGGQWHTSAAHSAVWPGMRTNTSRTTTAFSDFPQAPSVARFPRAEDVHAYLHEYAEHFGVLGRVRTAAKVVEVARISVGWSVRWTENGLVREQAFAGVVVASGRFRRPRFPMIPGLGALAARGRVQHSFDYRGREEFHGKRVLVYGNGISGLEIASDLAADHTITVLSAARRPRYIIQKVVRGLPTDWRWFNRFSALLGATLTSEEAEAGMRERVLAEAGDPTSYGGLPVDPGAHPKLAMNQEFLAYVAEGKIAMTLGVEAVEGDLVHFADRSCAQVDSLICATGYDLDVSFLSPDIRRTLRVDDTHLDLYGRTFHPDLPGLAILGQFLLIGPQFPIAELQARWVAATWSGTIPATSEQRMREGIAEHRAVREMTPFDLYPALAAQLAGELGVEPDLARRPDLAEALLFGPLAPPRWRLDGPGSRPEAEALLRSALADFGGPSPASSEQVRALKMVAGVLDDPVLEEIAERLDGRGFTDPVVR